MDVTVTGVTDDDTPHPSDNPGTPAGTGLTDAALDMLRMEERWWRYAGAKGTVIRDQLNMSATM